MDKALRSAIIAGIIIIALSFGYYLVIFLPKKEAMRLEQQKLEQEMIELREKSEKEELKQKTENEKATRKECADWALLKATNKDKYEQGASYDQKDYDDYFERCLREKGIK